MAENPSNNRRRGLARQRALARLAKKHPEDFARLFLEETEILGGKGTRRAKLEHGTRSCYSAGCRKPVCVAENRRYMKAYMREYRTQ